MAHSSELAERIYRVTQDLRFIQEALAMAVTPEEQARLQAGGVLPQVTELQDLKAGVDHMRHLLWGYFESESSPDSFANSLHAVRMQRVTEMLRALKPAVQEEKVNSSPEARTFFEEVNAIANQAIDRHHHQKAG